jgi:hypothetical protein
VDPAIGESPLQLTDAQAPPANIVPIIEATVCGAERRVTIPGSAERM